MKNIYKLLPIGLLSVAVAGCADLDTVYLGDSVSSAQKDEVREINPEMVLASMTGCFTQFLTNGFDYSNDHYDFGYSSMMIGLDQQGLDMASKDMGYNWYNSWMRYTSPNNSGTPTSYAWSTIYDQIRPCNDLLRSTAAEKDEDIYFFRAECRALRAFDYWVLAQLYQFNITLAGPTAPCVPIIDEHNMESAVFDGCARATVQEVYDFIINDLNCAIDTLILTGKTPASYIKTKPKRAFTLASAYGLRARVYLSMHKYEEAAADAKRAIDNFGGRPYTRDEISVPAFNNIDDPSWMWGIAVSADDRVTTSGIVNFPGMMGSFTYGYCTVGAWRWCNATLYDAIPKSDVRKGWFIDENFESDHLSEQQQDYINGYVGSMPEIIDNTYGADATSYIMPYTQVKFNSYDGVLGGSTNPCDIPLMRVEEMHLILAEATGMSQGVAAGKALLERFVKSYRDPKYTCEASTPEEFENECWLQRRIELWGEGMNYFDLMRLNKPLDRRNGLFPRTATFNIPAGDPALIYCIPLKEITNNNKISDSDNNPSSSRPMPVVGDGGEEIPRPRTLHF